MRDFPFFTTQHGVASLTLREIPYKGIAYVRLQKTQDPALLLNDCLEFCEAAGAKAVYATGNSLLESFPLHTEIWVMVRSSDNLPDSSAELVQISESNLEAWRSSYNERMRGVSNAATMTLADAHQHLAQGSGYYVYKEGAVIGIGVSQDDTVRAVISFLPGAGRDVLLALCTALTGNEIRVELASNNRAALKLYERLGFKHIATVSKWYQIK